MKFDPIKYFTNASLGAILSGVVLGILLEKSKVFDTEIMKQQILFENFVFLKIFLSAVATGMFLCSIVSMYQGHGGAFENTMISYSTNMIEQSYLLAIFGGLCMGAGIACSGACPVSLFVKLGSGVPSAMYIFLGAYSGTVLFDINFPLISKPCAFQQPFLHSSMSTPYFNVAMPLAVILATITFFLELHRSWWNEYLIAYEDGNFLVCSIWSPYMIGISTGLLQMILMGCFNKVISNSDVFTIINKTAMSIYKYGKLPSKSSKTSVDYFWVFFSLGLIIGAYFSTCNSVGYQYSPVTRNKAFLGGVLISLGSKMAAGCYIGHGISGVMLLSKLSFAVLPSLWAGCFIATVLLDHL